jgi:shikimate kinase
MKLILIGFMGSGKTTIGNILSKKLNMDIVDMDLEIEKNLNISINDIFNLYGEKYFRNKEVELLEKLLKQDNIF